MFQPIPSSVELAARDVIGAASEVHRALGPGFLETIYQEALCLEMEARGIRFERERPVNVVYRGVPISGQCIDLIVDARVVVELRASSRTELAPDAKVMSYLRSTGLRLGLLLNFNCPSLHDGIKRIVA